MAFSDGQEEVVEKLVNMIHEKGEPDVSQLLDKRGNTPLHIVAAVGSVRMCNHIDTEDSSLIGAWNHDNETPFFMAALYGHKDAFLCLRVICGSDPGYRY